MIIQPLMTELINTLLKSLNENHSQNQTIMSIRLEQVNHNASDKTLIEQLVHIQHYWLFESELHSEDKYKLVKLTCEILTKI